MTRATEKLVVWATPSTRTCSPRLLPAPTPGALQELHPAALQMRGALTGRAASLPRGEVVAARCRPCPRLRLQLLLRPVQEQEQERDLRLLAARRSPASDSGQSHSADQALLLPQRLHLLLRSQANGRLPVLHQLRPPTRPLLMVLPPCRLKRRAPVSSVVLVPLVPEAGSSSSSNSLIPLSSHRSRLSPSPKLSSSISTRSRSGSLTMAMDMHRVTATVTVTGMLLATALPTTDLL